MFCASCGKELNDNAKFCGGCGAPTKLAASSSKEELADTSAVQAEEANLTAGTQGDLKPKEEMNTTTSAPDVEEEKNASEATSEVSNAEESPKAAGFKAAGSGANPFASIAAKAKDAVDQVSKSASSGGSSISGALNGRMAAMNEGAEAKAFDGTYAQTAESDDIAQKAKKAAEERAARRSAAKAKAEERRGKKPVIAGFSDEEETSGPEHAVFAEGLPDWDLVPATPFMVDHKVG